MINENEQELLKYLKALVFDVKIKEEIPEKFKENGDFLELDEMIRTIRTSANQLGVGNLSYEIKGKGYVLGSLKSLQASLRNLTWKTQAIASGDFSQSVHFLGDFSDAFNSMTRKLESSIQEINEVREHFEMIFNTIPDATIITSAEEGNLIAYNKTFLEVFQYTEQEILDKHTDVFNLYNSKDQRVLLLEKLEKDGFSHNLEITFQNKNKEKFTGLISSRIIKVEGKARILSVIRDITSLKKLEEEIRRLSITDKLTQSYNRLKTDDTLEKELERSNRTKIPFSVILLDIDHFKSVNDTFGHQVGDTVLVELADILKNNVRSIDIVGRWGGEEFLIILPETDKNGAMLKAQKLRTLIDKNNFTKAGKITASFGVSAYNGDTSPESIVSRADAALYKAKENGRNRVEFF